MNKVIYFNKLYLYRYNSALYPPFKFSDDFEYFYFFKTLLYKYILFTPSYFYKLNIFTGGNVRAFRYMFGLPVRGQRTWSNAKTCSRTNNTIFLLKFNKFRRIFRSYGTTKVLFLVEYISLFI